MDEVIPGLEDLVEVGRGGFAAVYRAYQPAFRRTVAVKVLHDTSSEDDIRERFERECQAMGLISEHPNIVTVLDAGFLASGRAYLVMPYMPAGTLADRIRREGLIAWHDATAIVVKIAGAIHAAHDAGIVHRDVKPANMLISQYGEPKLTDFGIARIAGGHETRSGVVTASLAYGAPEIVDGGRPTVASDVYSLGATAYALLAGRAPFEVRESVAATLHAILTADPPSLRGSGVPPAVAEVVESAMHKDPAERPATAIDVATCLRRAQQELGVTPTEVMVLDVDAAERNEVTVRLSGGAPDFADTADHTVDVDGPDGRRGPSAPDPDDTNEVPRPSSAAVGDAEAQVPHRQVPHRHAPAVDRRRRLFVAAAVAVAVVVAGGIAALLALRGDGDSGTDPTAGDPSAASLVVDPDIARATLDRGYLGPLGSDHPSDAPLVPVDVGVTNPLEIATDYDSARVVHCPEGIVGDYRGLDLSGLDLSERDLRCSDFRGADLAGVDLSGSLLWASDFTGVDLSEAEFGDGLVQLQATVLVDADLSDQDLPDTDWGWADLSGADLTGAHVDVARLEAADHGEPVILDGATCPDGTQRTTGATCVT